MKKTIKGLFGYIGCIFITLAVMYYIDGTAGIILSVALAAAIILSVASALVTKRFINVEICVDKDLLFKGETLVCTVRLSLKIPLAAPTVEIKAGSSAHLTLNEGALYKASVAGKETTEVKIPYTALFSGAGEVIIDSVRLSDFLGIFSFNIPVPTENLRIKTAVYPRIPDAGVQTDFLKTTSQFSDTDDDEEETEETVLGAAGVPGYEHRVYCPGDPIKKINWKLSSKRDIYMIRLDERVCGAGQMFFLDSPPLTADKMSLAVKDNVIEGALAVFSMLVREGREASFFFFANGEWLKTDIRSQADILILQEKFAAFSPTQATSLIPPEILSSGKTPICFTCALSGKDETAAQISARLPEAVMISAASAEITPTSKNSWIVTYEFELKKSANNSAR
jgi:uncharacterized protein (DUF58 family)